MIRPFVIAFAFAGLCSAGSLAQTNVSLLNTYVAAPNDGANDIYAQQEPATIERAPVRARPGYASAPRVTSTPVIAGVWLRQENGAAVQTVSVDKHGAELRLERGRVNVAVNHPAQDSQILIDLPGGQTALLKDGVYTFNADSDTVHVLEGEAEAFPGNREGNGIKLKDNRMLAFGSGDAHAEMFEPTASNTDLLPGGFGAMGRGNGYGNRYYGGEYLYAGSPYYGYGWGPWGGYGYPYGYGWGPWGYGYPVGIGIGFGFRGGYYGGFRGGYGGFGGFRGGGYRGGFRR